MSVEIDVRDEISPLFRRATDMIASGLLTKAIGMDCSELTKSHLRALDVARPNRLGGSRTHYYARAAASTRADTTPGMVAIRIQQIGLRLHYYGGVVTPKIAKLLTIPATAEAHGKRAREFNDLYMAFNKARRPYALRQKGTDKVFYWLASKTTHLPDKSVIPSDQAYRGQAKTTALRIIESIRTGRRTVGGI